MMEKKKSRAVGKAFDFLRRHKGPFRTSEILGAGVHPRVLYGLRDSGLIEKLSRGLYQNADAEPPAEPDLVIVARRLPQAVVCLVSALSFHGLTTQIPRAVFIALPKGAASPRLSYPPLSIHRFDGRAFREGVEIHDAGGARIKVFNPEKTLVDCFKFRNKIGMDVVQEALRLYKTRQKIDHNGLMRYAEICRVAKVMKPYLEAFL